MKETREHAFVSEMADSKDKLEIEVGTEGGKISVEGEGAGQLSRALVDLISPITEGLGYLGDKVRVYRQIAAIEALERVHQIAKKSGLKLKPVPPKFLIPWLEKASLEEADSPLIDWWANLLVSAADPNIQTRPFFNDLISKISPSEAQLLEMLWNRFKLRQDHDSDERLVRIWITDSLQQLVTDAIEATPNEKKSEKWREAVAKKFLESAKVYISMMDEGGVVISDLRLPSGDETMFFSSEIYRTQPTSFQVCRALEILHDYEFTLGFSQWGMVGRVYSAKATFFTSLGSEFMSATHR